MIQATSFANGDLSVNTNDEWRNSKYTVFWGAGTFVCALVSRLRGILLTSCNTNFTVYISQLLEYFLFTFYMYLFKITDFHVDIRISCCI